MAQEKNVRTQIHICQSVEGALKNWGKREWRSMAVSNNMTPEDVKIEFQILHRQGKRVIPIGEPCEGFSYETGCPGHVIEEEAK